MDNNNIGPVSPYEELSERELFTLILGTINEDKQWELITLLLDRNTKEVYEIAEEMCTSPDPTERELSVILLGNFNSPVAPDRKARADILLNMV